MEKLLLRVQTGIFGKENRQGVFEWQLKKRPVRRDFHWFFFMYSSEFRQISLSRDIPDVLITILVGGCKLQGGSLPNLKMRNIPH